MAISNARQFILLLWKNWLLQKRQIILTIFQILLPPLFSLILLLIRIKAKSEFIAEPTIWNSSQADPALPPNLLIPSQQADLFWRIAYAPDDVPAVLRLVNETVRLLDNSTTKNRFRFGVKVGQGFKTEDELLDFFVDEVASYTTICGLVFNADSFDASGQLRSNATVTYKIRLRAEGYNATYGFDSYSGSSSYNWQTDYNYAFQLRPGPQGNMYGGYVPGYYYEGFLGIQRAVDMSIMDELSGGLVSSTLSASDVDVQLKSFPFPPYLDDVFLFILTVQFPFIIMLSFIVIAPTICKDVVLEKEKKLKESMKLMGMKAWLHWMSWFFKYAVFMLISVSLMTMFFHLKVDGRAIINYTHWSITFVFLLLYTLSLITFCFAISTFFSKASAAAAAGAILFLASYIPFFFIGSITLYPTMSFAAKAGSSIISNLAMGFGCWTLASYESVGVGIQWSTLNTPVTVDNNFTMLYTFLFLFIDIIVYALITWYFDAMFPGDFGTPEPFYFPFTKSYWCGRTANAVDVDRETNGGFVDYGENKTFFEDAPLNARVGIKVRDLTKKFSKIQRPAVNKLNIDMYEGQITALLGHNGAGKTTTMFMLTGFIPQTSGTAYINGYDLRTELTKIRENLGLCPQHDVLFDTLTVEEHLIFFAKLKGCPNSEVTAEVDNMIKVLHLEDKRKVASSKLSGGMKRKLSVGIALIAGSKFVILDEPTSGMDPEARRQAWDILQSQRAGRTMILSTHFMDEADLLGDRIAIMADGQLQCYGSPLFLKGKYGIGYHLTVVKSPSCNAERVLERIRSHVDEAQMESNVGAELSFILPREESSQFESLFTDLEQNRLELGIDSFGASVTTLEEVFLKVGEMCDSELQSSLQNGSGNGVDEAKPTTSASVSGQEKVTTRSSKASLPSENDSTFVSSDKSLYSAVNEDGNSRNHELFGVTFRRVTGVRRYLQQFYALLIKHFIHSIRNVTLTVVQIGLPILFTIIACLVEKVIKGPGNPPPLPLNMSYFASPIIPSTSGSGLSQDAISLQECYRDFSAAWGQIDITDEEDMDQYLLGIATNLDRYNRYYTIANTVNASSTKTAVLTSHYNNIALHAIAISLSVADNAILQFVGRQHGNGSNIGTGSYIDAINHPLPRSLSKSTNDDAAIAGAIGYTFSYLVSFGMAFLIATFVVFVVTERTTKAKQSQFIAGVGATNFWLSTFLWDALCYIIPSAFVILVVVAFQTKGYSASEVLGVFFFCLVMYGWSVLPFAYLLSFLFDLAASAYTWILVINIFTGTVAVLVVYLLQIPSLGLVAVGNGLEWFFYVLLPNFCFSKGIEVIYTNHEYGEICKGIDAYVNRSMFCAFIESGNSTNLCCPNACGAQCSLTNDNLLSWEAPGIGRALVFMGLQGAIFSVCLFFLESDILRRVTRVFGARESTEETMIMSVDKDGTQEVVEMGALSMLVEDDDVRAERERISRTPDSELIRTDKVILRELTKFYNGSFLAVDRLSVGIPDGECFGLLGVNGAGKTTTFKMMTGDEAISAGDARLEGFSVQRNGQEARERVGYCPQFDALIDQMTVTETLWMYARMRGVVGSDIKKLVEKMIEQLTLTKHATKLAKNLSGGNRRKLSTGIALIGNPSIVFLDEPTTGMDPVARRLLWNTLSAIRSSGRTLILTSHSMDECEALCTRLAIMVNGRFQCLGSPQRLKAKFGEGYSLIIKIRQGANTVSITGTEDQSSERRGSTALTSSNRNRTISSSESTATGELQSQHLAVKTQRVMEFVRERFPGSQLKDQHDGLLHFRVLPDSGSSTPDSGMSTDGDSTASETQEKKKPPQQQLSWSYVFGQIERAKVELDIEDYSVSQTTLEQIFISFARLQRPPQEVEREGCCGWNCSCGSCCKKKKAD